MGIGQCLCNFDSDWDQGLALPIVLSDAGIYSAIGLVQIDHKTKYLGIFYHLLFLSHL